MLPSIFLYHHVYYIRCVFKSISIIIQFPFMFLAFIKNPSTPQGKLPARTSIKSDKWWENILINRKKNISAIVNKLLNGNSFVVTREITNKITKCVEVFTYEPHNQLSFLGAHISPFSLSAHFSHINKWMFMIFVYLCNIKSMHCIGCELWSLKYRQR